MIPETNLIVTIILSIFLALIIAKSDRAVKIFGFIIAISILLSAFNF